MPATLRCDTITNASNTGTANLSLDASGNATVGNTLAMGSSFLRNRVINGAMVIDQRNAGASVTPTADQTYTVDRWQVLISQASKISVQQQTSVVPVGYSSAVKITSLAATSLAATDYFCYAQIIEGFNISDLAWGTANAKTVTLSFQVYSSLTGTFGGNISNGSQNRAYPFTYSIPSANTWTSISVTISGETSGSWNSGTNGRGIWLQLGLGVGSTYSGTAGSWQSSALLGATGAQSVVGTNGATFYITGVQLEVGSIATPFERRQYGQELMLCQRYYQLFDGFNGTSGGNTVDIGGSIIFPVAMRANPTVGATAAFKIDNWGVGNFTQSSANVAINSGTWVTPRGLSFTMGNFTGLTTQRFYNHAVGTGTITLSSEL